MDAPLPLAMLLLGAVSSAHCAGMCGGIVAAFSTHQPLQSRQELWTGQAAFNAGRIATYSAAGAAAGALGGVGAYAVGAADAQAVLFAAVNVILILTGLHLAGVRTPIAKLEALGMRLWRRLQPLAARLRPGRTASTSLLAGLVWGWLPCGLVYGALAIAAFAGSPGRGALAMLAFGLGTLPVLMTAGLAASQLRRWLARRPVRLAAGASVMAFGAYGLANAGGVANAIQSTLLCL